MCLRYIQMTALSTTTNHKQQINKYSFKISFSLSLQEKTHYFIQNPIEKIGKKADQLISPYLQHLIFNKCILIIIGLKKKNIL